MFTAPETLWNQFVFSAAHQEIEMCFSHSDFHVNFTEITGHPASGVCSENKKSGDTIAYYIRK